MNQPSPIGSPSTDSHQIERFQRLILNLYQCCQARIQRQSVAHHLPDAELRCLRLFDLSAELTPKEVAHRMGVVKSRSTKIIDGLVTKHLIQRTKDPEDSRIRRLRLTPRGQDKLADINRSATASNERVLARLTPTQRSSLLEHLEMLSAAMQAAE